VQSLPPILPWVGVLLLFLLPANRSGRALWVLVPLVLLESVRWLADSPLSFIPSESFNMLAEAFVRLAFGTAALWLASPYLTLRSRVAAFFLTLLVLGVASVAAVLVAIDFKEAGVETAGILVFVGVLAAIATVALSLTARFCRSRATLIRFSTVLFAWLALVWVALLVGVRVLTGSAGPAWSEAGMVALGLAAATFAAIWPFVVLAFANPWYRDRFFTFLALAPNPAPIEANGPPPPNGLPPAP
jgi:hypothetical protein